MLRNRVFTFGFLVLTLITAARAERVRSFEFTYTATVDAIPSDAEKVRLWLPYPTSDADQTIDAVRIASPYPVTISREPEYGNTILSTEVVGEVPSTLTVQLRFTVRRREQTIDSSRPLDAALRRRLLAPDRLVPITGRIAALAAETVEGKTSLEARSRAIYDYVTSTLTYDKSGTGWGRGDALYACDVRRGNCTDFHSLLIGMARAVGIPALFEIGFPIPTDRTEGEIAGYHCWAELYVEGVGWIPVDSSEASKYPEKAAYFYGNLDENRVLLTRGRDLILRPEQAGPPLNYFIHPYAEVDDVPYDKVVGRYTFRDLPRSDTPPTSP